MEDSGGHCRIYHGVGDSRSIDYATLVAVAPLDSSTVSLALPLSYGQWHFLAARAVSAAGVEEHNTHVVCCAEVDETGVLAAPPLAAVTDLTAWADTDGEVVVGFSYQPPPGYAPAEQFEVLSDRGTGALDLQTPVETVSPGVSADHEAVVVADVLPALFAVRACANGRHGPVCAPVVVIAPQPQTPTVVL